MRWKTGLVVLVGATTENPFFEVNSALISRSRIVELHSLSDDEIAELVGRAVEDARGLAGCYALEEAATAAIVTLAGGDGRGALTTLELAAGMVAPGTKEAPVSITEAMVRAATPHRALPYDKNKDMHYDIISAFIKSMRGSDPDAAVYWLARMIDGGEDPKFIARRMYIAASEDIGNADPQALLVAEAAFRLPRSSATRSAASTWPRPPFTWRWRRSPTAPRPRSMRRCAKCATARSARCRLPARPSSPWLGKLRRVQVPPQLPGRLGRSALPARGP